MNTDTAKTVAIIAPYFPPSSLAGVHRARHLAKHLHRYGWHPIIFCVHEKWHTERIDPGLAALLPQQLEIVKTDALPAWVARRFGVGDLSLRGFWYIKRALYRYCSDRKIDVVFVTMGPFYSSLIGIAVKRKYNIPLVLDYQDPWVSDWGATLPVLSKGGIAHSLAQLLEPRVIRWADYITSVSDGTNSGIQRRYRSLPASIFSSIPIGSDSDDFEALGPAQLNAMPISITKEKLTISYVGTVLPRAFKVIDTLFKALRAIKSIDMNTFARIQLLFIGSSNQPNGFNDFKVLEKARVAGITEIVTEIPQRVPYLTALSILRNSDILLGIGSDEPHYTASKLFPLLLSGKPVLGIYHEKSSVCQIAAKTGGVRLVSFASLNNIDDLSQRIISSLVDMIKNPMLLDKVNRNELEPFLAKSITGVFASVFDKAASHGPRSPWW